MFYLKKKKNLSTKIITILRIFILVCHTVVISI